LYTSRVGGSVKLSAFTVADAYDELPNAPDRLREVVRLAQTSERAGLDALWVAEHHFHTGGVCPSPAVVLAACGGVTTRLRLGSMVSVLPFHRPIDIAEQYATLDRLLGGRLNLGVGSGYISAEFAGFGVDRASKRERFEDALELMLTAFRGDEVHAAGPNSPPVRLNVRPVQQPHPPIWVAVQRREAIAHVARTGRSIALIPYATVANREELGVEIREYRSHLPTGRTGEVAVAIHLYAGERPDRARAAFRRYLESRLRTHSKFYQHKTEHDPGAASPDGLERSGFAVFASPREVVRELEAFEALGVDELIGIFDFGALDEDEVGRSVTDLGGAWQRRGSRSG